MQKFIGNLLCFIFWSLTYTFVFISDNKGFINWICYVIGFIGIVYIILFLRKLFFSPIKRDLLLMSGRFLKKYIRQNEKCTPCKTKGTIKQKKQ